MTFDHVHDWSPLHLPQAALHALNDAHRSIHRGITPAPAMFDAWFVCTQCRIVVLKELRTE